MLACEICELTDAPRYAESFNHRVFFGHQAFIKIKRETEMVTKGKPLTACVIKHAISGFFLLLCKYVMLQPTAVWDEMSVKAAFHLLIKKLQNYPEDYFMTCGEAAHHMFNTKCASFIWIHRYRSRSQSIDQSQLWRVKLRFVMDPKKTRKKHRKWSIFYKSLIKHDLHHSSSRNMPFCVHRSFGIFYSNLWKMGAKTKVSYRFV